MTPRYAKSTWLFGRGIGLVFLVAFVSFHVQAIGLIGEHGVAPAVERMAAAEVRGETFRDLPTIAWSTGATDGAIGAICLAGELFALLLLLGFLPGLAALGATVLYLSIHSIGGPFMAFQWDTLLIESGFLATLVLPWRPFHSPRAAIEPPVFARWAVYALVFRLMFLSGVVKLASRDPAWASLTAMEYHYFTQPLPNPLSWPAHQLPASLHSASVVATFVVELGFPFLIVAALLVILSGLARRSERVRALARWPLRVAFGGFAGLMLVIALTGNYGFFNLLTAVICLPLLDDAALDRLTPRRLRIGGGGAVELRHRVVRLAQCSLLIFTYYLGALSFSLGLGGGPSMPDAMHEDLVVTSPFRITNGYGLFAVMTRLRREIVIEGSTDGREWREYRFAHKPRDPGALPGQSAPHMPRLDWQMWFAALGSFRQSPWLRRFMVRLLEAEPSVLALLAEDPFDGRPPRYVRATLYDYRFGDGDDPGYWVVERLGPYSPPMSLTASRARGTR